MITQKGDQKKNSEGGTTQICLENEVMERGGGGGGGGGRIAKVIKSY